VREMRGPEDDEDAFCSRLSNLGSSLTPLEGNETTRYLTGFWRGRGWGRINRVWAGLSWLTTEECCRLGERCGGKFYADPKECEDIKDLVYASMQKPQTWTSVSDMHTCFISGFPSLLTL